MQIHEDLCPAPILRGSSILGVTLTTTRDLAAALVHQLRLGEWGVLGLESREQGHTRVSARSSARKQCSSPFPLPTKYKWLLLKENLEEGRSAGL